VDPAVAAAGIGIWHRDLATGAVMLSSDAADLLGDAPADFAGFLALIHPDDAADVASALEGVDFDITFRTIADRWLRARGRVVGGESCGVLIPTEATLREREAHLTSVLETVPDAMIVIDNMGIMQSFSATAERLFGYRRDEVVGRNVSMLMPSPYREMHDGYLRRYLETGERNVIGRGRVAVGLRGNGSTFPMELSVGEMISGGRRSFTGFIRDLTERDETQRLLQDLQAELIHISRLTAMGEMASTLAHELNQPLTAVASYLNGCRRLLAGSETSQSLMLRDAIDRAAEQALRAGQIIRRLRQFVSRGETERHVEDVGKLIEEASALALVGAKEVNVKVHYRFDPGVRFVLADKIQVQQVILNLIRNAIDAMQDSERRELTIATLSRPDDMVEVSVADTGSGIVPEVAAQLFQPFVTSKPHGMGVGLSISRTIVEAHGGQIRAESNPGGGTIFRLTLKAIADVRDREEPEDDG
jgi:two-component system sensor kinase FixL